MEASISASTGQNSVSQIGARQVQLLSRLQRHVADVGDPDGQDVGPPQDEDALGDDAGDVVEPGLRAKHRPLQRFGQVARVPVGQEPRPDLLALKNGGDDRQRAETAKDGRDKGADRRADGGAGVLGMHCRGDDAGHHRDGRDDGQQDLQDENVERVEFGTDQIGLAAIARRHQQRVAEAA